MNILLRLPPVAAIGGATGALVAGAHEAAQPLVLLAVMLAPALLPRRILYPPDGGPSTDGSGGDADGGGGRGPQPGPPKPPDAPRGGLPLPDAEPSRIRLRDHDRPVLAPRTPRRGTREPARVPQRRRA